MTADRRLPAEWEHQSAILLTWPHGDTDWAPYLEETEAIYLDIAKAILEDQNLIVSCEDVARLNWIQSQLDSTLESTEHQLFVYSLPADDTWTRDHGPITVLERGRAVMLDFIFNAWGDKYAAEKDDAITRRLHNQGAFGDTPIRQIDFVLEGGSIESDGLGTILTTSTCLMTDSRNTSLNRAEIESALGSYLGATRVLWLENGHLSGDDTDAHIDTLARFCNPDTICYVQCNDPDDEHYVSLNKMEQELKQLQTLEGEPYKLVPLPMASAIYEGDKRLPATYANFLITNHSVLLPVYGVAEDEIAKARLTECFPERRIKSIDCRGLIRQHGSLHCVTMQLPESVAAPIQN